VCARHAGVLPSGSRLASPSTIRLALHKTAPARETWNADRIPGDGLDSRPMKKRASSFCGAAVAIGTVLLSCCGPHRHGAPARSTVPSAMEGPLPEAPPACSRARELRRSVGADLDGGKLRRALDTIALADELCPAEAAASHAPRLHALVELGRADDAAALAAQIDPSRVANVRAQAERAASIAADALMTEADAARRGGDGGAAQRLLDRAGAAYERELQSPLELDAPPLDHFAARTIWSPDGRWLAVLHGPYVSLFSTGTWERRLYFEAAAYRRAQNAVFSLDGSTVVVELCEMSPTTRCDLRAHALPDGSLRCSVQGPRAGWPRLLSADGRTLVDGFTASVWDLPSCSKRFEFISDGSAAPEVALGRDGAVLAFVSADGIEIRDAGMGAELRTIALPTTLDGIPLEIEKLAFRDDGLAIASVASDGTITIWDVRSGKKLLRVPKMPTTDGTTLVAFDRRDLVITTTLDADPGTGGAVFILDASTGKTRRSLGPPKGASSLAVSVGVDHRHVVRFPEFGLGFADVVHLDTGKSFELPHETSQASVSPDGRRVAWSGAGLPVQIIDAANGAPVATLPVGHGSNVGNFTSAPVALSTDGRTLVISGETLEIWDLARAERRARLDVEAWNLAVSARNQLAAAGFGLSIVDLSEAKLVRSLDTGQSRVFGLTWSATGDRLAAVTESENLDVWAASDGSPIAAIPRVNGVWDLRAVSFAADAKSLDLVGKSTVDHFDLERGTISRRPDDLFSTLHVGPAGQVRGCDPQYVPEKYVQASAPSADCSTAAVGTHYGPVAIWRAGPDARALLFRVAKGADAAFAQSTLGLTAARQAQVRAVLGATWAEWVPGVPVEPLGKDGRALLVCHCGVRVLPLAVCEERFVVSGVVRAFVAE
jgi:WD40 repeat protein